MDWLVGLWQAISSGPLLLVAIGVGMALLSYMGVPLPQAWKQIIYDLAVKALQKILGISTPGPAPSVSDKAALDSFVVLKERCGTNEPAKKKLQELWVHLEPGV